MVDKNVKARHAFFSSLQTFKRWCVDLRISHSHAPPVRCERCNSAARHIFRNRKITTGFFCFFFMSHEEETKLAESFTMNNAQVCTLNRVSGDWKFQEKIENEMEPGKTEEKQGL